VPSVCSRRPSRVYATQACSTHSAQRARGKPEGLSSVLSAIADSAWCRSHGSHADRISSTLIVARVVSSSPRVATCGPPSVNRLSVARPLFERFPLRQRAAMSAGKIEIGFQRPPVPFNSSIRRSSFDSAASA
jgi:hypothetical protein